MEISPVTTTTVKLPLVPTEAAPAPVRPGKSGMAVGQLAKQAVADARASGMDLPSNAQGLAASQIAKGADPASIFAVQVEEPVTDPVEPPVDTAETPVPDDGTPPADGDEVVVAPSAQEPPEDTSADVAREAAAQYQTSLALLQASTDTSAQTALDLLS